MATKAELQQEVERLKVNLTEAEKILDDPRTEKVRSDLWTHDIYLKARKKMTVGVLAVLSIIALASGGSLYLKFREVSKTLETWAATEMREKIKTDVDIAIQDMINKEKPRINSMVNNEIVYLTNETKLKINKAKNESDKQISLLQSRVKEAEKQSDILSSRIKQTLVGMNQAIKLAKMGSDDEAKQPKIEKPTSKPVACDSQKLDDNAISIKQIVEKTDTFSGGDKRYYRNIFTVSILNDKNVMTGPTAECAFDIIDRVVYTLSERWFKPPEFVRIAKSDEFRFSMRVWGTTLVKADIYLKGRPEPLKRSGKFLAKQVTIDNPEFFKRVPPA